MTFDKGAAAREACSQTRLAVDILICLRAATNERNRYSSATVVGIWEKKRAAAGHGREPAPLRPKPDPRLALGHIVDMVRLVNTGCRVQGC